jgi:RimJ/RimL family protein N-acetyltransferase
MKIEPVILEGEKVRMAPLSLEHHSDLCEAGLDAELWRLIPTMISTAEGMKTYIETALDERARGVSLPFATVDKASGKAIGSTRFGNIDAANKRAEIGWTWITPQFQRTFVNTEAKYLMLRHAFEVWECNRVEFKTDALNEKSRNAILRIGAKQEGIFRQHVITYSGRLRDSVYFSIISSEWPEVKVRLEDKIYAGKA